MATYRVEMKLDITNAGDLVDQLITALIDDYPNGQVNYTRDEAALDLALSCDSDEDIEKISSEIVGYVRDTVNAISTDTLSWPTPFTFQLLQVEPLADLSHQRCPLAS